MRNMDEWIDGWISECNQTRSTRQRFAYIQLKGSIENEQKKEYKNEWNSIEIKRKQMRYFNCI